MVRGLRGRLWAWSATAAGVVVAGALTVAPPAQSAPAPAARTVPGAAVGHGTGALRGVRDQVFTGAVGSPTGDKPQSKLWYTDGIWWADMFDSVTKSWHIFRLDRTRETWVDTGTQIDTRANVGGDVLWDGTHLYVATNVVAPSSAANRTGSPARLFRYSYASDTKKWTLDVGFPVAISDVSSESLTLDKDSSGTLWATWTQSKSVYVNNTVGQDTLWGTPFVLPGSGATGLNSDDISTLSAYGTDTGGSSGNNKIAVLWSDQVEGAFHLATHRAGDPRTSWTTQNPLTGRKIADDHINLKRDGEGNLYAAVKTSRETLGQSAVQTFVLRLNGTTGAWKKVAFGTVANCHTRPVLAIDLKSQKMHVFATAPTDKGCLHTGTPGSVYEKSSPLSSPAFPSGRGTRVIQDPSSWSLNDATTTKQNVTPESGIVILASDVRTKRYWHLDIPPSGNSLGQDQ
jgi:hypothetical protein